MNIFVIFVIAVSLSMDTFSLSLVYGTLSLSKKNIYELSIIVGFYHFFMPLFGMFFGSKILYFLPIKTNLLVFLVLLIIGLEMIFESFKSNNNIKYMNFLELLMFGFAVSVDSFSVGIGLRAITNNILISVLIFSIISLFFTFLGLVLGKKISSFFGKLSTLLGGIILIFIGIIYLL